MKAIRRVHALGWLILTITILAGIALNLDKVLN